MTRHDLAEPAKELRTEHTPGPWGVERCDVTPCFHIDAGAYPFGTSVCQVTETPREGSAYANARLIAAAPGLLSIVKQFVALDAGAWAVERHAREKDELLVEARGAIAKATAP